VSGNGATDRRARFDDNLDVIARAATRPAPQGDRGAQPLTDDDADRFFDRLPGRGQFVTVAESLGRIASASQAGRGGATHAGAGGLDARIAAARSRILGTRGAVPPDRVRAALGGGHGYGGLPAGTALLTSRQQLLARRVEPETACALAILRDLRPIRPAELDPAEVTAAVRVVTTGVEALRREAVEPEPRQELVASRLDGLRRQLGRLEQLMEPHRDRDDHFTSGEDLQQRNRLVLLGEHLDRVEQAFDTFFDADRRKPAAVDRVIDVQAQLRVVADSVAEVRTRFGDAGASEEELAAPEGRLDRLDPDDDDLPRMTVARLLSWITDLAVGPDAADLPITGSFGLRTVQRDAEELSRIVARVVALGDPDEDPGAFAALRAAPRYEGGSDRVRGGSVADALTDDGVRRSLRALRTQLDAVAATAGGTR
jgi:hypothetical protein